MIIEPRPSRDSPDLTVVSPSVSDSNPAAGASFTLSATANNAGGGESAATTLRYYRSTDATITASDTAVGTDAVAGLAASGSDSQSVELVSPSAPGTYHYGACVAAVAGESDTTNNCSTAVKVTVPAPDHPDLAVVSPSVSNGNPSVGSQFTLSTTVQNAGNGRSATTTLRFYRSTDPTITTSDTELGINAVAGLAPSGSDSQSVDLTAPSVPGTAYYGACVDAVAEESNTTNNCSISVEVTVLATQQQLQGRPDLEVGTPTVSDTSPETGASFKLSATVSNAGDGESPATTLRYYRSTDATITAPDTAVGTDDVGALSASGTSAESISLTAPATAGAYYYGACVDAVTDESVTTDNCSGSVKVDVEAPKYPDLEVGTPTVSGTSPETGASFTLSATVSNAGDGGSVATTLRYYRSTDATITTSDTAMGTDAVGALAASGTSAQSISLTALGTAGAYYYGACVDAVAGESDTTDNCSASVKVDVEAPTHPDLAVGAPTVSDARPEPAASFKLSATVSNAGDGGSVATTLRYYRSTDATITRSDTAVGTDAVGALAASGTSAESISLTAPGTAGAYYYGACVDAVVGESDTTDNCSGSVKVDVEAPTPGTTTVEVTAPKQWAPVGDTVTFTAKVLDSEGKEISDASVTWSSSNTGVATVNTNGVVTAVAEGTATITATATVPATTSSSAVGARRAFSSTAVKSNAVTFTDTVSASAEMEVVQRASRIEIDPDSLSFNETGAWATLTATIYDADDNEMSPTYWYWSWANPEVATVYRRFSSSGVLSANVQSIGEGTTTVTLSVNGSATGTATVTVTLPTARVDISPGSLTFDALGQTKSVTVRILDENGVEDEDATFGYIGFSSPCCDPFIDLTDPSVISIEKTDDGLEITAEGPGRSQITISSTDVESAILPIRVYQPPSTLEVSPGSVSLAVDGTATLSATIKDANGHSIHVDQDDGRGGLVVYWETSDDAVATVVGATARENENTGGPATVTGVTAGAATITGRWGSRVRGTATVTVTE